MNDPADDRIRQGRTTPRPSYQDDSSEPASLPSLAGSDGAGGLNSLAQSARAKQISSARSTMFVVGALTIIANIVFVFLVPGQIDDALRKQGVDPHNVAPQLRLQVEVAYFFSYVILGVSAALGVVFILLGALVPRFPVPCTIIGLVLYVGAALVFAVLDPESLKFGWIIKIIIVVSLFKAVQAAIASERDKNVRFAGFADDA